MPLIPNALARWLPEQARLLMPSARKASRVGPLIAYETLGAPAWSGRDYAAFAREGFMQNAVVYRCVRMIAEAAASVPLLLYDRDTEITDHPLLSLLATPSPGQTKVDLLEAWYGFLLVSGNAYIEAVGVGGEVRELHILRPDRMKVIPGATGWPEAYEYTAAGGSVRFAADVLPKAGQQGTTGVRPILHVRLFHPLDDHYGMSPIEAAATAIDIHNQASRWNKALLDNAARPSGALVYAAREGRLSPEQFERLKSELQEGFQGAKNAGRPLLLEGGLDWKPLSLSPKDMDFIEAKNAAAREIALALGVPPMLLGIPGDNTYSNYQEASRTFWRQTILPLVTRTARAVSAWLAPGYSANLELRPDIDQIDALSGERDALWARLEKASFLTDDEKRIAAGYSPQPAHPAPGKLNPFHDDRGRFTFGPGGGQLVADYRIDLSAEEGFGHAAEKHIGKSDEYLTRRVLTEVYQIGIFTIGLESAGSFSSMEAANKLVSSTLAQNSDVVDAVARGDLNSAFVVASFPNPTGREAFRRNDKQQPIVRDTYKVGARIDYAPGTARGFRIRTAYPHNRQ